MNVRPVSAQDLPELICLLHAYMRETFACAWAADPGRLSADLQAGRLSVRLLMREESAVGFIAWIPSYDLHHAVRGGEVIDLFVVPEARGIGGAIRLLTAAAREIHEGGGAFIKGRAVESGPAGRLYARLAVVFPGADCIVGGRAFRTLAALAGADLRMIAREIPERAWNFEP